MSWALIARYLPHILIVAVLATIVAVVGHAVWTWGYDTANVRAEKIIGDFAKAEAEAQAKARAEEQAKAAAVAKAAEEYERGKADAQAKADRVVADLRAGTVRLRQHWQAAVATCDVSRDSAAALAAEREAELRAESAARIVRIGAEADAKVRALQDAYEALRRPAP
jgi:FtsZ-interacting cell division protein ZipA